jgi:hypothetical protein
MLSILATFGFFNLVALLLEKVADAKPNARFIIDDQHLVSGHLSIPLGRYWESGDHAGSTIWIVFGDEFASVLLHNSLSNGQAKASTATPFRKERFEDLGQILF